MKQFLKEIIKKTFRVCGFEIHRAGTTRIHGCQPTRTTMTEFLEHVTRFGFRPQTVIDVGVGYGSFSLYKTFPSASHLLVEPLEEFESALQEISRDHKAQFVLAAAGAKPGTIVINVHPDLLGSSILKETEGSHADGTPRQVPVVALDHLCKERNLRGPYLIKVDVQGAEIDVLDGAKEILQRTELIILEVSLFQFHLDAPQLYDVLSYMKKHGFVVYDIFGGINRPFDGALAQVNIAFVKESGQFRRYHFYATREQREQMINR